MPWSKVDGSEVDACDDDQVAVVKDGDGSVEGCHDTEDEADDQLAALNASEERTRMHGMPSEPFAVFGTATNTDAAGEEGYFYPLYLSKRKAKAEAFNGVTHLHNFEEFGQEMYMPDAPAVHAADEAPSLPVYHDPSAMRDASQHSTRADASDLSEGDYVEWDSSGGTAYGQVDNVAMGETVSGSLEPDDTEHETSEDNPGVIIELVERGDDGEVMGTGDTVFHRPDELRQISKSDVPEDRSLEGRSYRSVTEADIRQSGEDGLVTVQFMTEQVARDGMVLDADGLNTRAFEKNPVVLWSHGTDPRRGDEPVGKAFNIREGGDGMLADVEFAEDDFAQRIEQKVRNGFINAVSVGWRTEDIDRSGDAPTVTRSDMTEFSFVAVPADTDALVKERKQGDDLRHRIAALENELEGIRAQATATSPSESVGSGGTPSESSEEDRDDAQQRTRYVRLSDVQELREQRKQEKRKIIRTELKKLLGMA